MYYYEILIQNGKDFDIGVSLAQSNEFWVLKTLYGDLEHKDEYTNQYTSHACKSGDVYAVLLDTKAGQLSFRINGED